MRWTSRHRFQEPRSRCSPAAGSCSTERAPGRAFVPPSPRVPPPSVLATRRVACGLRRIAAFSRRLPLRAPGIALPRRSAARRSQSWPEASRWSTPQAREACSPATRAPSPSRRSRWSRSRLGRSRWPRSRFAGRPGRRSPVCVRCRWRRFVTWISGRRGFARCSGVCAVAAGCRDSSSAARTGDGTAGNATTTTRLPTAPLACSSTERTSTTVTSRCPRPWSGISETSHTTRSPSTSRRKLAKSSSCATTSSTR